jgi:hypothetical protein
MSFAEAIDFLRVVSWPVVVLLAIVLLRRELKGLFGRVREIEGPGNVKVVLDETKVEQIIAEGREKNAPAATIAARIVNTATVIDSREARILRALFDEEDRALFHYQDSYYRSALNLLLSKGHVRRADRGFSLTPEGYRVTRKYVLDVIQRRDDEGRCRIPPEPSKA